MYVSIEGLSITQEKVVKVDEYGVNLKISYCLDLNEFT